MSDYCNDVGCPCPRPRPPLDVYGYPIFAPPHQICGCAHARSEHYYGRFACAYCACREFERAPDPRETKD